MTRLSSRIKGCKDATPLFAVGDFAVGWLLLASPIELLLRSPRLLRQCVQCVGVCDQCGQRSGESTRRRRADPGWHHGCE